MVRLRIENEVHEKPTGNFTGISYVLWETKVITTVEAYVVGKEKLSEGRDWDVVEFL